MLCTLAVETGSSPFLAGLQFCADVPPGNARAKECLEDSREKPGFTLQCKEEVEKMMADRATDFRLDPKLRQLCADDIQVAPCLMPAIFCPKKNILRGHLPAACVSSPVSGPHFTSGRLCELVAAGSAGCLRL